ncbi:hypothetical protein [Halobacillus campisalis]|uniref:Transposase n=1 Tax=Halobacillus campisalis TaxID=435909 RepID=A0ABW2K7F7_9BACI|nr:hypothetical protein [Halobacillus campisalis]
MTNELQNVRVMQKPERGRYENEEVHGKSSDIIVVYNLFDQTWQTLKEHDLDRYFADETDFNRRKAREEQT